MSVGRHPKTEGFCRGTSLPHGQRGVQPVMPSLCAGWHKGWAFVCTLVKRVLSVLSV